MPMAPTLLMQILGATLDFINNGGYAGTGGITNDGTVNLTYTANNSNHYFESDITNNGTWTWSGYHFRSIAGITFTNYGNLTRISVI